MVFFLLSRIRPPRDTSHPRSRSSNPRNLDSETAEKPSGFVPTHPWKSSNESNLIATTTRTPLRDFTIETSIRKFPSTIILQ